LKLDHNYLEVESMAELVKGNFPSLQKLDLSCSCFNAVSMKHLAKGKWPLLGILDLSETQICFQALHHLMKGRWHNLECLDVADNKLGASSFVLLTGDKKREWKRGVNQFSVPGNIANGMWPNLRVLDFGDRSNQLFTHWPESREERKRRRSFGSVPYCDLAYW